MIVYLNGRFVPEHEATVSVLDRGFLYGDGLFETIRASRGRLLLWEAHRDRFGRGAQALRLEIPATPEALLGAALEVLGRNGLQEAMVRIHLSRGVGPRGYSPREAREPTLVIAAFPAPAWEGGADRVWRLWTAPMRLPAGDPLAGWKTASKLVQVMARAAAEDAGADEALLLNTAGLVAEASSANVFWFEPERLCTPSLSCGVLAGVTRGLVLRLAAKLGWRSVEAECGPEALRQARGVFLTNSGFGVREVGWLDGRALARDPRFGELRGAYLDWVRRELSD